MQNRKMPEVFGQDLSSADRQDGDQGEDPHARKRFWSTQPTETGPLHQPPDPIGEGWLLH